MSEYPKKVFRNVFFVASPLQLLCATEARSYNLIPRKESLLVICQYQSGAIPLFQIVKLWRLEEWPNVLFLPDIKNVRTLYVLPWLRSMILAASGNVEKVFFGADRALFRCFYNSVGASEAWLIDDGSKTLAVAQQRNANKYAGDHREMSAKLKCVISRLFGMNTSVIPNLNYFSCFDIDVSGNDTLVKNEFLKIKSDLKSVPTNRDVIYFLGAPLIELQILSASIYREILSEVAARLDSQRIVYYPHRHESASNLEYIEKFMGWSIAYPELPIEAELAKASELPFGIAGIYSSALQTCHVMFGSKLERYIFRVPSRVILKVKYREVIEEYFNLLESEARDSSHVFRLDEIGGGAGSDG